jgi:hypothetical protein
MSAFKAIKMDYHLIHKGGLVGVIDFGTCEEVCFDFRSQSYSVNRGNKWYHVVVVNAGVFAEIAAMSERLKASVGERRLSEYAAREMLKVQILAMKNMSHALKMLEYEVTLAERARDAVIEAHSEGFVEAEQANAVASAIFNYFMAEAEWFAEGRRELAK